MLPLRELSFSLKLLLLQLTGSLGAALSLDNIFRFNPPNCDSRVCSSSQVSAFSSCFSFNSVSGWILSYSHVGTSLTEMSCDRCLSEMPPPHLFLFLGGGLRATEDGWFQTNLWCSSQHLKLSFDQIRNFIAVWLFRPAGCELLS